MSWSDNWPLTADSPASIIQSYDTLIELWEAVRERFWCLGNEYHPWPPTGPIWYSGIIGEPLTDNGDGTWTLTDADIDPLPSSSTDDGRFWNGVERTGCGTHPPYWIGVDCPAAPYLNGMYDVIIEYDSGDGASESSGEDWYRTLKPWFPMRGNITANTNETLTFTAKLENFAVANCIPSTDDLVGKRYYIKRTGKLWWADVNPSFGRWPDWPNDNELWRGDADEGKVFDDDTGYLYEATNKVIADPYNVDDPAPNSWGANVWRDKQVLVFDTDGNLHRLTVTSNNGNTLFFGGLTAIPPEESESELSTVYTMDSVFTIVDVDARGFPNRINWPCFRWYSGYHKQYYGHSPRAEGADATPARYPAIIAGDNYVYFFSADGADCDSDDARVTVNSLDNDIHTDFQNFCSPADFFPGPQIHKTIRQLEKVVEDLVGSFVRPVDYTGEKRIPDYSIARCFYDCGINNGFSSVAKSAVTVGMVTTTTYYFVATGTQYKGKFIYYEVIQGGIRQNEFSYDGNTADATTGRVTVFVTTDGDTTVHDANWLGADVYWSAGWTRKYPLLVTHFYPRWFFVPDIDTDEFGNHTAIFPPEVQNFEDFGCFGVGQPGWIKREPSTSYKIYDERGEAQDGDGRDFVQGDVVRFDGDHFHDPGTGQTVVDGDVAEDLKYWDRQFTGKHKRQIHPRILDDLIGTITSGTKYSLTDSTKNWWRDWFEGGELVTHSGAANDGSETSLTTDDTWNDTGSGGNENSCWFDSGRFPGFDAPFVDFILEVDKPEHDPINDVDVTTTYKLPITDVTTAGTAQVIHFDAVEKTFGGGNLMVLPGDNWRIREPDSKLNRYRGHRVEITKTDGSLIELDCLLSDDDTLFFDVQDEALEVGWTFKIIEYYPGGCWTFSSAAPTDEQKAAGVKWQKFGENKYWIQPTGEDDREDPVSSEHPIWHTAMEENEPHHGPPTFGRMRKGDYVWFGLLNQLYLMINRLRWVKKGAAWTANGDTDNSALFGPGASPGLRYGPDSAHPFDSYSTAWSNHMGHLSGLWGTGGYPGTFGPTGGAPTASLVSSAQTGDGGAALNDDEDDGFIPEGQTMSRKYSYPEVLGCPILMFSSVAIYAFAQINADDDDEGVLSDFDPVGSAGQEIAFYHEVKFDPQSTPLVFRAFALVATMDADNAEDRISSTKVGDAATTFPSWTRPPDPVPHQHDADAVSGNPLSGAQSEIASGYIVTDQEAILKFDVAGGLAKVT
jgi:hypothetical protein